MRPSVRPGTLVDDRYEVEARLGSGGMADVWLAHDRQLGRRVALKLLHRHYADDAQFVERFRREASAAAGLQHPNIVAVYDRGQWDGTYYIAMEHLEGRTLKDLVRQEGLLEPGRAIDIAIQVLRAARFAHRRGVVHRDLKPHNVIVDAEDRAKVTDFGIARAGASDMTETGSIVGTAHYLAPEQAQGRPVSAASDLYSIGVVLYELLTGRVPFDAESAVSIALKHVSDLPIPPSAYNPQVAPALEGAVLHALEKDPARRFADADEFIAALEQARAPVPVGQRTAAFAAAAVGAPPRAEDGPTRIAAAPAAAAPPPTAPPEALPPPPERRRRRWPWVLAVLALAALAAAAWLALEPDTRAVPDVVGRSADRASMLVQAAGFSVDIEETTSEKMPRDRVVAQDPGPGEEAEEGATVTLTVSTGPGEALVPDVRDEPKRKAARTLRQAGFRVDERTEPSEEIRRGRVVRTSPPADTVLERRRTVVMYVSSGAPRVTVPSVFGQPRDVARAEIEAAGLTASFTEEESADATPGTVLRQDPGPGAQVPRGSTVQVVVARRPPARPVPEVEGLESAEAVNAIRDAGFRAEVRRRDVEDPEEDDRVLAQRPAAGEQRPEGSTVRIVVGRHRPPEEEPPPDEETPMEPPPEGAVVP